MFTAISRIFAAWPQVVKRSLAHWRLLSSVVVGVVLASAIMSGTIIYFDALRELALKNTLVKLTDSETNIIVKAERGPTTVEEYTKVRDRVELQVRSRLDWMLEKRIGNDEQSAIRGGKTATFFLTVPGNEAFAGEDNARSYFAFSPGLEKYITIVEGQFPNQEALDEPDLPFALEALVPRDAAEAFGVGVGDSLSVTPFWKENLPFARIYISGLFDRIDPDEEFWHLDDTIYTAATATNFRTVPFYISEVTYMQQLGSAFTNMITTYAWLLETDRGELKASNSTLTSAQLRTMKRQLGGTLFSYRQVTKLDRALDDYDRRLFFSKLPMFIILVLISVVVLYYVVTLSALLVDQQRTEIALLRSRGASSGQILVVFVLEGVTIALLAIIVAPLIAAAAISVLGVTPAFSGLSDNDALKVNITGGAYLMSALGGLLSLLALMIPAIQASRITEVSKHRQESSRPTEQPFFQRYYLDIMLLVISLILFRQLSEQESVVAVGLFGQVAVDQIMLAVPALILIAFAMVLLRLFPLAIRFLSGDSPMIVHIFTYASVALLVPSIIVREAFGNSEATVIWIVQPLALLALVPIYWYTNQTAKPLLKIVGYVIQALLIAAIALLGPNLPFHGVFLPILVLIVPGELLFLAFRRFSHIAPVGYSMGLWQMARNPTHYARLSLLLILMAGLGIFAASFGGTLERSFEERALYSTGSDMRLSGILRRSTGPSRSLENSYKDIEGVESAAPVLRAFGTDLSRLLGESYTMISVDANVLKDIAWFREDFSAKPMPELLGQLPHDEPPIGIELPPKATHIGVRLKANRVHPTVMVAARIRDSNSRYFTYRLGTLNSDDWMELESSLTITRRFSRTSPVQPTAPITLVSLSVHELDGRNRLRAGSIAVDEVYYRDQNRKMSTLEQFTDRSQWSLMRATPQSITDSIEESREHYNGDDSTLLFVWSDGSPLTSRGVFHGPPITPIPVLASESFLDLTDHKLGEDFEVSVRGHRIQVRLVDKMEFFPTLDTFNDEYLISDLDSLIRYANLEATSANLRPDEIWLSSETSGSGREQLVSLFESDEPFIAREIFDQIGALDDSQVDPLVQAGWRALLFMAFAAVLILTCLGFLVHAYVSFREREVQFALMRTIGFSLGQLTLLVWLEQVLVIVAGLALGTFMGGRLGAIIMPFLAHDDQGSQVVPPFILQVNWTTLAITYGIMAIVFAIIITGLILFIRRISLQRVLRLGEM